MKPGFRRVPTGPSNTMRKYGFSVIWKMKKKIMLFATLALLVSSIGFVYAQDSGQSLVANNLLEALDKTRTEMNNQFSGNISIPEDAQEALDEAEEIHLEAQEAYDNENYALAVEKATEAFNKYGEASSKLADAEDEGQKTFTELGEYERAQDRLEKLRELATDLEDKGVNVSEAKNTWMNRKRY